MKRPLNLVGVLAVGALALAGCSSGGGGGSGDDGDANYVDAATFTMVMSADAGSLDPQMGAGSALNQVTQFAYDALVSQAEDGSIQSHLASDWSIDGTEVTFTLNDGIMCADGSEFTAETAVRNLDFVGNPENESPLLGVYMPAGSTQVADGNTITMTLATASPFVLQGLANLPMVCDAGMEDRTMLTSATDGTGAFELTEAVPNDHYTYTLREGYTWGPNGATTDEAGLPATAIVRVVENATTAANLILNGDVNAGAVVGADAERLLGAELFAVPNEALIGQQWYNHAEGHATSDPDVRMALTQGADYSELQKVMTSGTGGPATAFAVVPPAACVGDSVTDAMPAFDVDAATALLEGKTPGTIKFLYDSANGPAGTAAAELAIQQWEALGFTVDATSQDATLLQDALFNTGDWDVMWITLNVSTPDQLVGFLSGDTDTNFGRIDNQVYTDGVAEASTQVGVESCPTWLEAEASLVKDADVIPFANTIANTFGNGAEFTMSGSITPTSIRMLG